MSSRGFVVPRVILKSNILDSLNSTANDMETLWLQLCAFKVSTPSIFLML